LGFGLIVVQVCWLGAALLIGCDGGKTGGESLDGNGYFILGGSSGLSMAAASLSGTGEIVFEAPLPEVH
jgi:hypothetical protein